MRDEKDLFREESFDFKYYYYKFLDYWYVFPIVVLISLGIAYYMNHKNPEIYRVETTLLIRQEQSAMDLKALVPENLMGGSTVEDQRVYNEIGILKSYALTKQTIHDLDFEVSYYREERLADKQLYHLAPFSVEFDRNHLQPLNAKFRVKANENGTYHLTLNKEEAFLYNYLTHQHQRTVKPIRLEKNVRMGDTVETDFCRFSIIPNSKYRQGSWKSDYYFSFQSYERLYRRYHNFEVSAGENSTILTISLKTRNVEKGKRFLDNLMDFYLKRSVRKKNEVAQKTIEYIESQASEISDSLRQAEEQLEEYRSSEQLLDVGILTEKSYENLDRLQSKKAEIMVKLKYFEYLKNYLSENKDVQELVAPSSMGVEDPLLQNLLGKLSDLYSEKTDMEINSKKENPYLAGLKVKISELRRTLLENIENLENKNNIRLNDVEARMNKLSSEVKQLPLKQRQLYNIERQFELYNELYTYLLKKRSETEIGKAGNIPVHEVIDQARLSPATPIAPKSRRNYLMAILLGLVIPGGAILLRDYFNDRVTDSATIERITDFPIVGNIMHKKTASENIVYSEPRSPLAEAFRAVRTNFQFIDTAEDVPVAMITSSGQGEGKSFVSINLASSFALYQKKTVLVSFDLRRPNVYNIFHIKNQHGLSCYLSNNCDFEDIIFHSDIENLDVIPAGHIPPNPSELIASPQTAEFFQKLKAKYDYIVIDTPPVGLVTDAYLLVKYATTNLFVVRHNHTSKRMLQTLVRNLDQKNIRNVNILINDINMKSKGYEYQYGYNYDAAYY